MPDICTHYHDHILARQSPEIWEKLHHMEKEIHCCNTVKYPHP